MHRTGFSDSWTSDCGADHVMICLFILFKQVQYQAVLDRDMDPEVIARHQTSLSLPDVELHAQKGPRARARA